MKKKLVRGIRIFGVHFFEVDRIVSGYPHVGESRRYVIPNDLTRAELRINRIAWMIGQDLKNKWAEKVLMDTKGETK